MRTKIEYDDVIKHEAVKETDTDSNNESDTVLTKLKQEVNRKNFENMLLKGNTDCYLPHPMLIWHGLWILT